MGDCTIEPIVVATKARTDATRKGLRGARKDEFIARKVVKAIECDRVVTEMEYDQGTMIINTLGSNTAKQMINKAIEP